MVNGVPYDFESIRMNVPAGKVVTLQDLDYDGEKGVEVVTTGDGEPYGSTRGEYKGMFKAVVSLFEFNILNESVSETGILGAPPMPVTVKYGADGDQPVVDKLEVKIEKFRKTIKKGTDLAVVELTGKQTRIADLNGVPAYVVPRG